MELSDLTAFIKVVSLLYGNVTVTAILNEKKRGCLLQLLYTRFQRKNASAAPGAADVI
jgi:hypothetical protein